MEGSFPCFFWFLIYYLQLFFSDESEDESDIMEASEDNVDGEDTFMNTYSDALNEELKNTTLKKSFVRTDDQLSKKNEVAFSYFACVESAEIWIRQQYFVPIQ
jgi:hypothetical protein